MKKHIILIMLMLVSISLFGITDIYVKNPCCGQTVYKNTVDLKIRWDHTSKTGDFVKIRLFDSTGNTKIFGITDKTKNDGEFTWTKSSINGIDIGDYVIRVKSLNNNYWDDSDVFHLRKISFHIATKPKLKMKPSFNIPHLKKKPIKIFTPVKNGIYHVNQEIKITWDKNFGNYNYVQYRAYLISASSKISIFGYSIKNTGVAYWSPMNNYNNHDIFVEIFTSDNKYYGRTEAIKILLPQN